MIRAFGFAAQGLAHRRWTPVRQVTSTLGTLSLSAGMLVEGSAPGTAIGSVNGRTTGAALTLADDAGGRFTLSGDALVAGGIATDYEAAPGHQIILRETLAGASNSPRDTVLTVTITNVPEQPLLSALSFAGSADLRSGSIASGTITGATAGSSIAASGLPQGFAVNGPGRAWTFDGSGQPGTSTAVLTETLADSANSPRSSSISVTIAVPARFGATGAMWGDPTLSFGKAA